MAQAAGQRDDDQRAPLRDPAGDLLYHRERPARAPGAQVPTVLALSFGSPPLAIARAFVATFSGVDRSLGIKIEVADKGSKLLLRLLDDVRGPEVREYVDAIARDQGAMVQVMPEAMDLYIAGKVALHDPEATVPGVWHTMARPRYVKNGQHQVRICLARTLRWS